MKYVVIGGTASIVHGVSRTTFDLDIVIEDVEALQLKQQQNE